MLRRIAPFVIVAGTMAACSTIGQSALNPFNWFGASTPVATTPEQAAQQPLVPAGTGVMVVDNRPLVTDVTEVEIAATDDGALLRATGVVPATGYYNAQLVRVSVVDGVATYRFVAEAPPPSSNTAANVANAGASVASRTISAATTIGGATLDGIRTIRVIGDTTSRIVSR